MHDEKINYLGRLYAEFLNRKASAISAGLGEKAADIAADGVGRRTLEFLPYVIFDMEAKNQKIDLYKSFCRRVIKAEIARGELAECCEELFSLVETLSIWLANAYIDPILLPDIGRDQIEPPSPEDVIEYAKECIHGES